MGAIARAPAVNNHGHKRRARDNATRAYVRTNTRSTTHLPARPLARPPPRDDRIPHVSSRLASTPGTTNAPWVLPRAQYAAAVHRILLGLAFAVPFP